MSIASEMDRTVHLEAIELHMVHALGACCKISEATRAKHPGIVWAYSEALRERYISGGKVSVLEFAQLQAPILQAELKAVEEALFQPGRGARKRVSHSNFKNVL